MFFWKMHGLGNDFVIVDLAEQQLDVDARAPQLARRLCRRMFGIGADGLVFIAPHPAADCRMRIFNPDGSEAQMCGNAIRCVALYLRSKGRVQETLTVQTPAGIKEIRVQSSAAGTLFRVDMGEPRWAAAEIPVALAADPVIGERIDSLIGPLEITCLSMGNPHCVIPVDDLAAIPLERVGPQIETLAIFPERTNVEFVQVVAPAALKVRVWERGAGATLACGTGACASLVACCRLGLVGPRAEVELPGGTLHIEWDRQTGRVYMEGPAEAVFTGNVILPDED